MKKVLDIIKRHSVEAVVILALILAGFAFTVLRDVLGVEGNTVVVTLDGEVCGEYSLYVDAVYDIGEGNILTVSGGEAYMSYASCPDKKCVKMGRVSISGERIICLPNRVTVEIR